MQGTLHILSSRCIEHQLDHADIMTTDLLNDARISMETSPDHSVVTELAQELFGGESNIISQHLQSRRPTERRFAPKLT